MILVSLPTDDHLFSFTSIESDTPTGSPCFDVVKILLQAFCTESSVVSALNYNMKYLVISKQVEIIPQMRS